MEIPGEIRVGCQSDHGRVLVDTDTATVEIRVLRDEDGQDQYLEGILTYTCAICLVPESMPVGEDLAKTYARKGLPTFATVVTPPFDKTIGIF